MTNAHTANKFFEKHRHATLRHTDQELEQLLKFAEEKYGTAFLEVSTTELHRAFFRNNNGFEEKEKLECPYATMRNHDEIDCARDFDQKSRIHKVTRDFCNQCWERQQRKKVSQTTAEVQAMKTNIHRYQERVNETIRQERDDIILCPNSDQVISKAQCRTCDLDRQERCQRVMQDPMYQRELAKVRGRIA